MNTYDQMNQVLNEQNEFFNKKDNAEYWCNY